MSVSSLEASGLPWRKARRSCNNGACVEVAPVPGQILVRDSMDRNGPMLRYSGYSWRMFVAGIKTSRFDQGRL
jgi:Domain of unknown function (DUF397)